MTSAIDSYWRLQKPYSPNFLSGYMAGHKWAEIDAEHEELSRIAETFPKFTNKVQEIFK